MRSAMPGLVLWVIVCMGSGAPTPSVAGEIAMRRCTDPLRVQLQVRMATGPLQFSGAVCGSEIGELVLDTAVPPELKTAEDLVVRGGYQRSGEQLNVDLTLTQEDQSLGRWTGQAIPIDGTVFSLEPMADQSATSIALTLSAQSFPGEESAVRVIGTLPAAQMATRLAALADWQLEGADLLPPVDVKLNFEMVELFTAMQLISETTSVHLERIGPRSLRFVTALDAELP